MEQAQFQRRLKILLALVILAILVLLGRVIANSLTFHLVSTDPKTSNVATISPFIKLNFNRSLSAKDLNLSQKPSLGKWQINGKTLTISVSQILNQNTTYYINVNSIEDTSGDRLTNIKVTFRPQFVSSGNLEQSQQKAILQKQDSAASLQQPTFTNTDALISEGLTTSQVQNFEQGITQFAKTVKISLSSVVINSDSLSASPITGSGVFGFTFNLSIDGTEYQSSLQYTGLESIHMTISDSQGAQLYQYGNLSSNSGSSTGSSTSQLQ